MTVTMYNAHLVGKLLNGSRFPGSKLAVFAFSHSLIKNLIIGVSFCECNSRSSIISATAFRFCSQLLRALRLSGFSSHSSADNFAFCTACSSTQRLVVCRSITHKNSVNASITTEDQHHDQKLSACAEFLYGLKLSIRCGLSVEDISRRLRLIVVFHSVLHWWIYQTHCTCPQYRTLIAMKHQWSGLTLMNATFLSPIPSRAVERSQSIFSDIWYSFGETVSTTETALE